jgi:glycerol-3-phosphate cytidylyltransferase/D-beta-D-heptose 7-phosphate kinase/D-beta-D-heptose 1-phosphate adenosyltransferase
MVQSDRPARASIVSGYFGPLHDGHLDLFEAARARTGHLIVIVNNDQQQILKKGRMIQPAGVRRRIVAALRVVDASYVAVEDGPGMDGSFDLVRAEYPGTELEFCNGGDRTGDATLPAEELAAAQRNDIRLCYGVGGTEKADSSTRIIAALEG